MSEPQVTVRTTEAGRVTEVVVPYQLGRNEVSTILAMVRVQVPRARLAVAARGGHITIRQPNGPNVVVARGDTLRIAAGRVERVKGG